MNIILNIVFMDHSTPTALAEMVTLKHVLISFSTVQVSDEIQALLSSLRNNDAAILQQNKVSLTHVLLFGDASFDKNTKHPHRRSLLQALL